MVYILNTNLKNNKKVRTALCDIYGIGNCLSNQICDLLGFSEEYKIKSLTNFQIQQLSQIITQNFLIGGDLRRDVRNSKNRLVSIGCYRGFRHNMGLPVRGQRTHGNGRTARREKLKILNFTK
uniref:Small ribosomal subunit protein uS13m n=1 Tax=Trebouxia aggregata TaxID=160068 RepID=G8XP59_9CHLO|nr:ribosomal protein S13 [Trebouxia aggregata]